MLGIFDHVKWVHCHHGMARPVVADSNTDQCVLENNLILYVSLKLEFSSTMAMDLNVKVWD
jgi:hypothetical protein